MDECEQRFKCLLEKEHAVEYGYVPEWRTKLANVSRNINTAQPTIRKTTYEHQKKAAS